MGQLKVTQTKSKIGDTVVKEDRPEIRGMVNTVIHLVKFEEVK
jgi:large subunit ribosomal protein L30